MVIVTQNQYLLATKILHITMDEQTNYVEIRKNGAYHSAREKYYQITIVYVPEAFSTNNHHQGHNETRECTVNIRGAVNAHKSFNSLMEQIREQIPDTLFLDKAVEKMFGGGGTDYETIGLKDQAHDELAFDAQEIKHVKSNRRAKAIRKPRKAKRASKKVLRGAKRKR